MQDRLLPHQPAAKPAQPAARRAQRASRPPRTPPTAAGYARADRLRSAVVARTGYAAPFSRTSWAKEFDLLARALNDDARLDAALAWLCAHMADRYTPVIHSAAAMRKKFSNLEAAMSRSEPTKGAAPNPEHAKLITELQTQAWPKEADAEVPAFVVRSAANIDRFFAALEKMAPRAADYIRRQKGGARELLTAYCHELRERLRSWEEWSGSLTSQAWSPLRREAGLRAVLSECLSESQISELKEASRGR